MNQQMAIDFIVNTRKNVFLTGESGSGKTWVINECKRLFEEKRLSCAVTATTGIAATHINGVTIHSLTGIGPKTKNDLFEHHEWFEIAETKRIYEKLIELDVIIIDEISMLHDWQFLAVDFICRKIRRNSETPFGGIQVVVCGDFFQLPPVSRYEESNFVHKATNWQECNFITCYLTEQHRQGDEVFLNCLRDVRSGQISSETQKVIESLLKASDSKSESRDILKLFPKNMDVDRLNHDKLDKLPGELQVYEMTVRGKDYNVEKLIKNCLAPQTLELKIDAKVMFVKNNFQKGYCNGTVGKVVDFIKVYEQDEFGWSTDEEIGTLPVVQLKNGTQVTVKQESWVLEEYREVRKGEFVKEKIATISQLPLRLAWATTIHKCVAGSTLIGTEKGFRYIEDVSFEYSVKDNTYKECIFPIWSNKGYKNATQIYNGGEKDCIKIITESGFSLIGSLEHPILIRDANGNELWKKMSELIVNDVAVMQRGFNLIGDDSLDIDITKLKKGSRTVEYKIPEKLTKELAWVLGVLIGDGCVSDPVDARIDVTNTSLDMIQKFTDYMYDIFGVRMSIYTHNRHMKIYTVYCNSWYIRNILEQIGLSFNTARTKYVPSCILKASSDIQKYFIQGLFDTDGGVANNCVHLTSSSKRLLKEVQILLLNLNIISSFRILCKNPLSYRLQITGINANRFTSVVNFSELIKMLKCRKRYGVSRYVIPKVQKGFFPDSKKMAQEIYNVFLKTYGKKYGDRQRLHMKFKKVSQFLRRVKRGTHQISCEHVSFLLNLFPDILHNYSDFDTVFFEKIIMIEKVKKQVYDLYIPENHVFIGNGFINHNSQGMSLDEADLDLSEVFELGMGYVALSRVRSLDGLILRGINDIALKVNEEVIEKDKEFRKESFLNESKQISKTVTNSSTKVFEEAMQKRKKLAGINL